MGSFSSLAIGLSFLVGFILMGFVAEVFYLLRKKRATLNNNNSGEIEEPPFFFRWKNCNNIQQLTNSVRNHQEGAVAALDLEMGPGKDSCFSQGYDHHHEQEGVEAELMRIHNLCGPPRFLFTINEESKEDLESEDGRSRSSRKGSRTKSFGDLVFAVDAPPFLTPLSSPTVKNNRGYSFDPLFEVNGLRSSPPPKFKFLKEAEDKLIRRLLMEEIGRKSSPKLNVDRGDSITMDGNNRESKGLVRDHLLHNKHASQVAPLASSPTWKTVIDTME